MPVQIISLGTISTSEKEAIILTVQSLFLSDVTHNDASSRFNENMTTVHDVLQSLDEASSSGIYRFISEIIFSNNKYLVEGSAMTIQEANSCEPPTGISDGTDIEFSSHRLINLFLFFLLFWKSSTFLILPMIKKKMMKYLPIKRMRVSNC